MSTQGDTELKLLAFLCGMTPRQFSVIQEIQRTDFTGAEPERTARTIFEEAERAGIRSSVIYAIVKHYLSTLGIEFDRQKLNNQRYGVQQYFEQLGTQSQAPIPPLVIPESTPPRPVPPTSQT